MSLDFNKYVLLFECCQLTKGHSRTLLVDTQRRKMEFLDNEMYEIFSFKSRFHSLGEILNNYDQERKKIIIEYFEYLLENEYVFYSNKNEIKYFTKLNLKWDHPSYITNAIIDFNKIPDTIESYVTFISDLDELGCENIQIRDFYGLPVDFFKLFLPYFDNTILYRIELLLKFSDPLKNYVELANKFSRIDELIIHSAEEDRIISLHNSDQRMCLTRQKVTDENCCGIVSVKYFNLELPHYLESNNYNTCLNRKISIDSMGNIKNCPSLKNIYGSIFNTRIKDVIRQKNFSKAWNIKKDMIDDCKVCEFRHICTDCRAYLDDDHSLKKPAKCNYNPYTNAWE